jgi:hypothetical protein
MLRRTLIKFLIASPLSIFTSSLLANDENLIEVWKSPTCGCCKDWIIHLESNGFKVVYYDTGNNRVRHQVGMPKKYGSCHTAIIGDYVIEGHVPASDILKLIDLQSKAIGLSVPGMPIGSPGMDGPEYKGRKDPFDVLLVTEKGHQIFSRYSQD